MNEDDDERKKREEEYKIWHQKMKKEIESMRSSYDLEMENQKLEEIRKEQEDQPNLNENIESLENGNSLKMRDLLPEAFPKSLEDLVAMGTDVGKQVIADSLQDLFQEYFPSSKKTKQRKKQSKT